MSDFFPTDVRVRLSRDGDEALFGQARKVLFHALNMKEAGSSLPITVVRRGEDGTTITAQIGPGYKNVTIYTPPPVPPEPKPIIDEPMRKESQLAATMLSGWTMRATISGDTMSVFHPTMNCAAAYNIPYAWQTNRKLATSPNQLQLVKPGMFSGTMKRIAQGLLGMGIIKDRSPLYFGGAIPSPRQALVSYGYTWLRTHGIYKAGEKNHWLVEISKERGILAMPLPILANTRAGQFHSLVASRHDAGTQQMLDEFGGLPSGEDFPATGAPLEDAITAGSVLRLMTASELDPFYVGQVPWYAESGWAFSENGSKAHNTGWRLSALDDRAPYRGNIRFNYRNGYTFANTVWGEHWGIAIELSEHGGETAPTGSAELKLFDKGRVEPFSVTTAFFPDYVVPQSDPWAKRGDVTAGFYPGIYSIWDWENPLTQAEQAGWRSLLPRPVGEFEKWGFTVTAFFDGERLETVRAIHKAVNNGATATAAHTYIGTSVRVDSNMTIPFGNLFIPRFCREGYMMWSGNPHWDPVLTAGYFSGVGVVSLDPLPTPVGTYKKVLTVFHQHLVDHGPLRYFFPSQGQFDAVVNAGPSDQYMMHNGARVYPPFGPSGPHEFVTLGLPDGVESIHPYQLNYVGGHPEGTT